MTTILNHPIVRIQDDKKSYRVYISMAQGGVIEHTPFPRDIRGLVAAIDLARDCIAGKFFPMKVVSKDDQFITEAVKAIDDMTEEK